jgi:hypothetical protein
LDGIGGRASGGDLRSGEARDDGLLTLHRDLDGLDDGAAEVEPDDALVLAEHGMPCSSFAVEIQRRRSLGAPLIGIRQPATPSAWKRVGFSPSGNPRSPAPGSGFERLSDLLSALGALARSALRRSTPSEGLLHLVEAGVDDLGQLRDQEVGVLAHGLDLDSEWQGAQSVINSRMLLPLTTTPPRDGQSALEVGGDRGDRVAGRA